MSILDTIKVGDRVTILSPQGQEHSGRAVMRGPHGWVLNMGGRYGTPGVATERNIVRVRRKNPAVLTPAEREYLRGIPKRFWGEAKSEAKAYAKRKATAAKSAAKARVRGAFHKSAKGRKLWAAAKAWRATNPGKPRKDTALVQSVKRFVKEKYAWPGGYPMFMIMSDGDVLCHTCTKKNLKQILTSTREKARDGWKAGGVDINYEDKDLYCANCDEQIEVAYS